MKLPHFILSVLLLFALVTSCEDTTTTIGSSLVTDKSEVIIDSAFTVKGHAVSSPIVQSRTITQLLGRLDAKEYGSFRSDFVTQFMPSIALDTTGVSVDDIDSIKFLMFMDRGDFTGDSLLPMGLNVYLLNKQLPSPIYSDFNPEDYYSKTDLLASQIYTANALYDDSINDLTYRSIMVKLPREFGQKLYSRYIEHPETFASPSEFTSWFPGFYVSNTFGSGRVININESRINLYYRQHTTITTDSTSYDTVYNQVRSYFAVTPEVITNNNIKYSISPELQKRIDSGEPIIAAPTGTDLEITFPAAEIVDRFKSQGGNLAVLNTVSVTFPVELIDNSYDITPPSDILMVLSKDKDTFFSENQVPDSKTSFLLSYNSGTKNYIISDMRTYLLNLMSQDAITAEDVTFTLTPVNIETETITNSYYGTSSEVVTSVSPYVTRPAMVRFDLDNAKIKLTFSKQTM